MATKKKAPANEWEIKRDRQIKESLATRVTVNSLIQKISELLDRHNATESGGARIINDAHATPHLNAALHRLREARRFL